jgi:type I restriction enzyme S subunit
MQLNQPDCWAEENLDNLATFIDYRGKTPVKTNTGVPLITAKNIKDGYINREPREFIALSDYDSWMTRGIPKVGDVLITTEAPMGNVALVDISEVFALAQRAICLQFFYEQMSNYAHYALRSPVFQRALTANSTGTTVSGIKASTLKMLRLPIPPLAEQKVIAHKLDTLLAQVDNTKARLERIPEILKSFRQSVLAAAVSGKLVAFSEPKEVTVGCVTTDIRYGTSKKCDYDGGKTPVIRIPNIGDRKLNLSDLKYADFTVNELETLALKAGDILVIRSNGSLDLVAKPALVDRKTEGFLFAGYLIRLRCNKEKVLPSFLLNVMSSRVVRDVVEISSRSTSGVNNINSKELSSLHFILPSLTEQTEIVRRVEDLFAFSDRIEQAAQAAQSRVNHLTQSILAKAFRGELTADWRAANPDLISGDNSAEALLAKINAERMQVTKKNKVKTLGQG